ncbi:MAG TPA: amidohydrolase [Sphingobacteriaceae bacterium]|nr:amidohydrolase [Sphingobacteriaceae bacterium]
MTPAWLQVDEELAENLVAWRRHLHQYPELSYQEYETTEFIIQRLQFFGIEVERPTATGAVGLIQGSGPGPTVAIRADIDALPIHEANTFSFRSRRDGVMHACGHDGHTAILLGVARILSRYRDQWPGRVKLLFQPAEETAPGGAQAFIAAGVLDDVDCIIGLHLSASTPLGKAGIRAGGMLANTGWFEIEIQGRGDLPGFPHRAVDTAVTVAQVTVNLQTIVSRYTDPVEPVIINVRQLQAGGPKHFFIPRRAVLAGTISSFDDDLQEELVAAVERVAKHTCGQARAECRVRYYPGLPALVNDEKVAAVLAAAARTVLGDDAVIDQPPVLVSDDFAYYCREVPGGYFFLGAGDPDNPDRAPHHHPRFDFDERALPLGVRIMAGAAYRLLHGMEEEIPW